MLAVAVLRSGIQRHPADETDHGSAVITEQKRMVPGRLLLPLLFNGHFFKVNLDQHWAGSPLALFHYLFLERTCGISGVFFS